MTAPKKQFPNQFKEWMYSNVVNGYEFRVQVMYLIERFRFDRDFRRRYGIWLLLGFLLCSAMVLFVIHSVYIAINWSQIWENTLKFLNKQNPYVEVGLLLSIIIPYVFFYWSTFHFRFLRLRRAILNGLPLIRPTLLLVAFVCSIALGLGSLNVTKKSTPSPSSPALSKTTEQTNNKSTSPPSNTTNGTTGVASDSNSRIAEVLETLRKSVEAQLGLVVVFIALGTVFILLTWVTVQDAGVFVLPFSMDGNKDQTLSRSISDSLVAELHRIKRLHEHPALLGDFSRRSGWFLDLRPATADLTDRLVGIGTVTAASTSLQIGTLFVVLKRLWPFGKPARSIIGSVRIEEKELHIVVRVEGTDVQAFQGTRDQHNNASTLDLVKELGGQIAASFSGEWRWASLALPGSHIDPTLLLDRKYSAFEVYSLALEGYLRHATDLNPDQVRFLEENDVLASESYAALVEGLESAMKYCLWLAKHVPEYNAPQHLLCRIGLAYLSMGAISSDKKDQNMCYQKSSECFEAVLLDEVQPLAFLCLGIWHSKMAELERQKTGLPIEQMKSDYWSHLENAQQAFRQAISFNPYLIHARFNLAATSELLSKRTMEPQTDNFDSVAKAYQDVITKLRLMSPHQRSKLSPGERDIFFNWMGWHQLGRIASKDTSLKKNHVFQAMTCFMSANTENPADYHAMSNLGLAFLGYGRTSSAVRCWKLASLRCLQKIDSSIVQLDRLMIKFLISLFDPEKTQYVQSRSESLGIAIKKIPVPRWVLDDLEEFLNRLIEHLNSIKGENENDAKNKSEKLEQIRTKLRLRVKPT